ncbi:NUDIX hydrolase [Gordonia zhaorongruii]|uniref:NUDIX hydrolase n=1 Tax=Gordonia zhaorongruii TaxID=2597659 RepID=UPI001044BFE0|nr:NUDIX domain-containing protein [Gordonia zhaorongruii]
MAQQSGPQASSDAPPRDASTVVLVRDSDAGIEVFLQRRVQQMAFAGGMTVFPGGGVDPRDRETEIRWEGPGVGFWADVFSTDDDSARALVCAAVRETFEECGVLLAGSADAAHPDPSSFVGVREALVSKELWFAQFLNDENLVLRADLLSPLAHWITPKNEPRRYDTRFFLASLPDGQAADGQTSEAAEAKWMTAGDALADWNSGRHFLLPPTWSQLRRITEFGTVAELIAAPHRVVPIEPVVSDGTGLSGLQFTDSASYLAQLGDGRMDTLRNA